MIPLSVWLGRWLLCAVSGLTAVASIAQGTTGAPAGSTAPTYIESYSVASVRRSTPGVNSGSQAHIGVTGVEARNISLIFLIKVAYGVQDKQIVGAPAWVNSELFDVVAKSDEVIAPDNDWTPAQRRTYELHGMLPLQNLMAGRFGLKVHFEDRESAVYALVVAKGGPKLQPGGTVKEILGWSGNGIRPLGPGRLAAMQATVDQLAHFLDGMYSNQLGRLVIDKSELTATYDFELQWAPDQMAETDAVDLSRPSLFTAIQEQLGLKLEPQRAPVRTLVIDHVEEPSEN